MSGMLHYSGGGAHGHSGDMYVEKWRDAHGIVKRLLYGQPVKQREWQDLFQLIHNVSQWLNAGNAFMHSELTTDILQYVTAAEMNINIQTDDSLLLRAYFDEWDKFSVRAEILPKPFKFFNQSPVQSSFSRPSSNLDYMRKMRQAEKLKPIESLMQEMWSEKIFVPLSDRLRDAALRLVRADRNGEMFDDRLVVAVRESFVMIQEQEGSSDLYEKSFEEPFIAEAVEYYKERAAEYLEANGVSAYMTYADAKLEEELERSRKYLHFRKEFPTVMRINKTQKTTKQLSPELEDARNGHDDHPKHMAAVTHVLVGEFIDQLLAECASLVRDNDVRKMRQLYHLMRRVPTGMETILKCIDAHIRSEGCASMHDNVASVGNEPETYVAALLSLYDRFSALVAEAFENDTQMLTTRDKAFEFIVNDTSIFALDLATPQQKKSGKASIESKCPELLANYADMLLRRSGLSKKLSTEQIDEKLTSLLLLLKYVKNKDVFMRIHKLHLSRRLVLETSADQEKEEQMMVKLRETGMPTEHVQKLFRMLQDIEMNKTISADIRANLVEELGPVVGEAINVRILNAGAWGRGGGDQAIQVSLPSEIDDCLEPIETHYRRNHNGRKLNWIHHWSTAVLTFATAEGCSYDLEITSFQLAILHCWQARPHDAISLEALRTATQLPDIELARNLGSLSGDPATKSRYQILLVVGATGAAPNSRAFNDFTEFRLNHGFKLIKNGRPQTRGRISMIGRLQLNLEAAVKQEHEDIVKLRQFRVQEAVVKIMKMRKEASLVRLECELIEMLKSMFVPCKVMVKEQIEWLIENGFISRHPEHMDTFVYTS